MRGRGTHQVHLPRPGGGTHAHALEAEEHPACSGHHTPPLVSSRWVSRNFVSPCPRLHQQRDGRGGTRKRGAGATARVQQEQHCVQRAQTAARGGGSSWPSLGARRWGAHRRCDAPRGPQPQCARGIDSACGSVIQPCISATGVSCPRVLWRGGGTSGCSPREMQQQQGSSSGAAAAAARTAASTPHTPRVEAACGFLFRSLCAAFDPGLPHSQICPARRSAPPSKNEQARQHHRRGVHPDRMVRLFGPAISPCQRDARRRALLELPTRPPSPSTRQAATARRASCIISVRAVLCGWKI